MKKKNTICVGHHYKDQQRPEYQSKTQHKEKLLSAVFIAKTKVAIIYVSVDGYFILLRKTSVKLGQADDQNSSFRHFRCFLV
jgi:hypothetical protein